MTKIVMKPERPKYMEREEISIDKILGEIRNYFYEPDKTIVSGSVGDRIWASCLESVLGFKGDVNVVHYMDLPDFFKVDILVDNVKVNWISRNHIWYPSHVHMDYGSPHLSACEDKFITRDDCAVSIISIKNESKRRKRVRILVTSSLFTNSISRIKRRKFHGFMFYLGLAASPRFRQGSSVFIRELNLSKGEEFQFNICFCLDRTQKSCLDKLESSIKAHDPLSEHISRYNRWFGDNIPHFKCDDPYFTKMWYYRWYLLRYNMARPGVGNLTTSCFYEGRHGGWFPRLISFSVPVQLMEARWLRDKSYCWDQAKAIVENKFLCATINEHGHSYANWSQGSIWEAYLIHPDIIYLKEVFQGCCDNLEKWLKGWGYWMLKNISGDLLPVLINGGYAGREYSPSFRYFTNYKAEKGDIAPSHKNTVPLKAVDVACYFYRNVQATANMAEELGRKKKAARLHEQAKKIKKSVSNKMWDKKTQFFYDIRSIHDEKALVKTAAGFFPFWAKLANERNLPIFRHLKDANEFRSRYPVPSVAMDEPAYRSDNTWFGQYIHCCMWNGLNFPYTTSHVIEAVGNASSLSPELKKVFVELMNKFTHLQYIKNDLNSPCVFEEYNPETGEYYNNCHDYLHSYYNDLLIRFVGGLRPRNDGVIELDPIDMGWIYFKFDRIPYRGREITLVWKKPGKQVPEIKGFPSGYSLYINRKLKVNRPRLERIVWR